MKNTIIFLFCFTLSQVSLAQKTDSVKPPSRTMVEFETKVGHFLNFNTGINLVHMLNEKNAIVVGIERDRISHGFSAGFRSYMLGEESQWRPFYEIGYDVNRYTNLPEYLKHQHGIYQKVGLSYSTDSGFIFTGHLKYVQRFSSPRSYLNGFVEPTLSVGYRF